MYIHYNLYMFIIDMSFDQSCSSREHFLTELNHEHKRQSTVHLIKYTGTFPVTQKFHSEPFTQRNKNLCPQKGKYKNVYNHFICSDQKLKQLTRPPAGEWINILCYIYTMESHSAIRNKSMQQHG
jgi:hypothetical protein